MVTISNKEEVKRLELVGGKKFLSRGNLFEYMFYIYQIYYQNLSPEKKIKYLL